MYPTTMIATDAMIREHDFPKAARIIKEFNDRQSRFDRLEIFNDLSDLDVITYVLSRRGFVMFEPGYGDIEFSSFHGNGTMIYEKELLNDLADVIVSIVPGNTPVVMEFLSFGVVRKHFADATLFRFLFSDGDMTTQTGKIVWEDKSFL